MRVWFWMVLSPLLLCGCGGGSSGSDGATIKTQEPTVFTTRYVVSRAYDICQNALNVAICNLAISVRDSISYGADSGGAAVTIPEIVAFGSGDCSEYSIILAAELTELGIPWRRYDVKARNSAIHAFVEIQYSGSIFVVDPTLGIVYRSSFREMLANPLLAASYDGTIAPLFVSYGGVSLFQYIDFFIGLDFELQPEVPVAATVILDSDGKYSYDPASVPAKTYLRLYDDQPLTILRSDGYLPIRFSTYDMQIGISIPAYSAFTFTLTDNGGLPAQIPASHIDVYRPN